MGYILSLFLLLSSIASAAVVPGPVGTINIAGTTLATSSTIVLHTEIFSNNRSSLYRIDGTTRGVYQVTAGKTFIIDAVCVDQATASGTAVGNQLLYADNSVGGLNQSTSMTNPVGMLSGVAAGSSVDAYDTTAVIGYHCVTLGGSAPASKYPYVELINSHDVITVYGHEQ